MNPLKELAKAGQSVWLDYIRRNMIETGELKRILDADGLRGVTSNPAIFEKAIAGSTDYTEAIKAKAADQKLDDKGLYEILAIADIKAAADVLREVYDSTKKHDGYVSLEVAPTLARETEKTLEEARRLWKSVNKPNLMVKVPGTAEGAVAIKQLISEGININVTLLFSPEYYQAAAEAYISGLEARASKGEDVSNIASVASFFISRIDSLVDSEIDDKIKAGCDDKASAEGLKGKVAIANAKLVYQSAKKLYASERWKKLEALGAKPQRLLWASTSTKNPKYSDVLYVEELIGPDTVNTIPPTTFDAFRDHGKVAERLETHLEEAHDTMQALDKLGVSFKASTDKLLDDGIRIFEEAFEKLLKAVSDKREELKKKSNRQIDSGQMDAIDKKTRELDQNNKDSVEVIKMLDEWDKDKKIFRLWSQDASLWTGQDEGQWMGWLNVIEGESAEVDRIEKLRDEVITQGFTDVVVTAMGGSSLCPYVMMKTFPSDKLKLHVLDSTDPAQVKTIEDSVNLRTTLFVVSSKSGSTLEPNIFELYFFDKVKEALGNEEQAGQHFIAVTDPGSNLEKIAADRKFRSVFHGVPSIGGRYSALSNFGMVPAGLMGVDLRKFLSNAEKMAHACYSSVKARENPGVRLGVMLGVNAALGRDKVTLHASPKIGALGSWLEQLLAESTGKLGRGIVPIDTEKLGSPDVYSKDRVIAYIRLESNADRAQDQAIDALEAAGHTVVRLNVPDIYHLGAEFFRWEIATAVAGSILEINAFNQPDVEASKIKTREITNEYEKTGTLPDLKVLVEERGIKIYTDDKNAEELEKFLKGPASVTSFLRAHYSRVKPSDYANFSAYIEMNELHERLLQEMRIATRNAKRMATCLGFGPRFLHSTGQAYKGGPNSGVFMQITCDDAADLDIPDRKYTFGIVKETQARGDFGVLAERGRRAIRVHLGSDVKSGLQALSNMLKEALRSQ